MNMQTNDALWDFALSLYQSDVVEAQCLWLQETYDVNINMLLWSVWCGVEKVQLDAGKLNDAEMAIGDWQNNVVLPLRQARQYIKAVACDSASDCRAQIKVAELLAERQTLNDLAQVSVRWPKTVQCCWQENLQTYLQQKAVASDVRDETLRIVRTAILAT